MRSRMSHSGLILNWFNKLQNVIRIFNCLFCRIHCLVSRVCWQVWHSPQQTINNFLLKPYMLSGEMIWNNSSIVHRRKINTMHKVDSLTQTKERLKKKLNIPVEHISIYHPQRKRNNTQDKDMTAWHLTPCHSKGRHVKCDSTSSGFTFTSCLRFWDHNDIWRTGCCWNWFSNVVLRKSQMTK